MYESKKDGEVMPKLTDKQKRFCEEYLIDLNGTRAYLAAYPRVRTEAAARTNASRLLTNANIQDYISELQKEQSKRTGIKADDVINELKSVAFTETNITGKEKIKALELLGKHLGLFANGGSDDSKVLEKLDEVLGGIKSEF